MKTALDPEVKKELLVRVESLQPASLAKWGKMNVHQMICHLTDQLRDLEGTRPVAYEGNIVTRFVLRPLLSRISNWPKAIFPAAKKYDQHKEGTKPTEFTSDKNELLRMLQELDMNPSKGELPLHPAFGKLSHKEYARIVYKHFDHHLKQFGA